MQRYNVKHLVRACDVTYSRERVAAVGVTVHDMQFADGDPPPPAIIDRWLDLCKTTFQGKGAAEKAAISVHCVAGLGRAPVMVAIALIEAGVEPLDAVDRIRKARRGAINARQLQYLETSYKRKGKLKGSCAIV
jgi:protein tyrosine phosphatase type 4A